jgi:HAD superfamily hydrolase (TIGR01509 family)
VVFVIEAVIFDMDGLLIDSEPLAREAWRATCRRSQPASLWDRRLAGRTERMLGRREAECAALVHAELGLSTPIDALCRQRNDLFLASLPGRLKPMAGARELLAELHARGVRRALATSGERRYVAMVMRELELDAAFEVRVVAEDVAHGKPAPDVYVLAAQRLSLTPAACLVLEDAPNGIAAAKAAGMNCVAVPNAFTRALDLSAADARLPSLVAVREELDALMARRWMRRGACPPPCSDGTCAECQGQHQGPAQETGETPVPQ